MATRKKRSANIKLADRAPIEEGGADALADAPASWRALFYDRVSILLSELEPLPHLLFPALIAKPPPLAENSS